MLKSTNIFLRALEPDDFDFLYEAENEEALWHVGELKQPISLHTVQAYLENAHQPIEDAKQARFAISTLAGELVGLIDLFDYDAKNQRAGLGVVVLQQFRGKGFAQEAIERIKIYAKEHLLLHQLHAEIQEQNEKSLSLFKHCGFEVSGILKNWQRTQNGFENVYFLQCCL
jgi:diamine N-acetyltransferase